jgi:hypothetical protein
VPAALDRPVPKINYDFVPPDGHNVFREKFGALSDSEWCQILVRSIKDRIIEGVHFPGYPEDEFQNRIHGGYGAAAMAEAGKFYTFVKANTYVDRAEAAGHRLLDFGSGWGRIIRPYMRDFEFANMHAFEPNLLFCALARTLNPYVTFLSGSFSPSGDLPSQFYHLVVGWSVFSHLSPASAVLWLTEMARIIVPGGQCVFTTWGDRFLKRLQQEESERAAGKEIHWYSSVCLAAAGEINQRLTEYERGQFVWFTGGKSTLYGEAFISEAALKTLLAQYQLPFSVSVFDRESLGQDVFVLRRL